MCARCVMPATVRQQGKKEDFLEEGKKEEGKIEGFGHYTLYVRISMGLTLGSALVRSTRR